ncbi:MAG: M28 family peptidase [Bacteroidota bacterium]
MNTRSSLLFPVLLLLAMATGSAQNELITKYANTITEEDVKAHIYFLADDLMEGRETGERGQRLAAAYIRSQFMKYGLAPGNPGKESYFQTYLLNKVAINKAEISLGKKTYTFPSDFFVLQGLPPETLSDQLAVVGTKNVEKVTGQVEGKMVLLVDNDEKAGGNIVQRFRGWRAHASRLVGGGAQSVGVVLPDSVYSVLSRYASSVKTFVSKDEYSPAPIMYFSEGMADDILAFGKSKVAKMKKELSDAGGIIMPKMKKFSLGMNTDIAISQPPAENVAGYLEGTDKKDELVIITAHYDHIGVNQDGRINNGADDDASGTTAVLELAEAFSIAAAEGNRPSRSILFMTVSGEEKGLLGSEYYTDNPIYPLENTVVNLNIDMVGRVGKLYQDSPDSLNYVYLIGSDRLSTELHEISEKANDTYTQMVLDYKYNDENDPNQFYYRSDHYNFAKNNIPVIFYFNGVHEDYHRPGDTPDKIRLGKLAKTAQLVFATAWELANREKRIIVDKAQ